MATPKLAVIVGSNRRDSINRKLAVALGALAEGRFDVSFVRIDDLPIFNQDFESEPAAEVVRFKNEITGADGILIVTPEHNRSIPAVLKNAIDWGTRPWGQNSWAGKPVMVTGTSPGAMSTALGQQHLRSILVALGTLVMGGEAYINFKPGLIDEAGRIADDSTRKFLQGFLDQFATLVARLAPMAARSAA
ncbi:MAG TPA: NADPH-dependent FMN reductase [Xanthobacteraceae bacterium]|nr:NADPH-dependent FMN reductase [Xanthobacteraceae bacterium]